MKRWQEELAKHPIHSTLERFQQQAERDIGQISPIEELERLRFAKVVRVMQKVVAELDPELAPLDTLNQLNSTLVSHGVVETMLLFSQNPTAALFQQANSQINACLSYVYQLAALKSARFVSEADVEVASTSFELFVEATRRELLKLASATSDGVAKINSLVSEGSTAYSRAKIVEESVAATLSDFRRNSTEEASQRSQEFIAAQNRRQIEFSELALQMKRDIDEEKESTFESLQNEIQDRRMTINETIDAIISDARQKHASILELYGLTAKDSVNGGHKRIATIEFWSAEVLRGATILLVLLAVAWVLYSMFNLTPGDEPDRVFWVKLAKSISITLMFISLAVYTSKQSGLHRLNERRAREFSLQVQAFDPFIASLPIEKRESLKVEMSKRIFAADNGELEVILSKMSEFELLDKPGIFAQVLTWFSEKKNPAI